MERCPGMKELPCQQRQQDKVVLERLFARLREHVPTWLEQKTQRLCAQRIWPGCVVWLTL
jgi:hypothetical protein